MPTNEHDTDEVQTRVNAVIPDLVPNSEKQVLSPAPGTVGSTASIAAQLDPSGPSSSGDSVDKHALPQYFHGSSEDILDWPVFQSRHNREQIERLIFDPALHLDHDYSSPSYRSKFSASSPTDSRDIREEPRRRMSSTRGIREEDVSELVERFLSNVHTKNPILDSNVLRGMVKSIAGEGFGWDARTCLVVSTPQTLPLSTASDPGDLYHLQHHHPSLSAQLARAASSLPKYSSNSPPPRPVSRACLVNVKDSF